MPVKSKEKRRAPMQPNNTKRSCPIVQEHNIILKQLVATIDAENNNNSQDCNEEVTNDSRSTNQSPCCVKLVDLFQNDSPYLKYFKEIQVQNKNGNNIKENGEVTAIPTTAPIMKKKRGRPIKVRRGPKKQLDNLKRGKRGNKRIRTKKNLTVKATIDTGNVNISQDCNEEIKENKPANQINRLEKKDSKVKLIEVETKSKNETVTNDSSSTNQFPCCVKLVDLFRNDSPYLKYFKEVKVQNKNGNNLKKDNGITLTNGFVSCFVKLVDLKLQDPACYLSYLAKIVKNKGGRPKKVKRGPKKQLDNLQKGRKANKRIRPKKEIIIVKMPFKRRGELLMKNKYNKKRKLDKKKKKEKKRNKKMPELKVTSEIYDEFDYKTRNTPAIEGNVISEFPFLLPKSLYEKKFDGDNDLERPQKKLIKIEHSPRTNMSLVGLQVWRGAFLLGDLSIYLGLKGELKTKTVLELGAGTGITSFVASMFADNVVCTDMNTGGILDLIKLNAKYNSHLIKSPLQVLSLDFTEPTWSKELMDAVSSTDIILAADDNATEPFVRESDSHLAGFYSSLLIGFNFVRYVNEHSCPNFSHYVVFSKNLSSVNLFGLDGDSGKFDDLRGPKAVIYDDDVTAAFVATMQKILNTRPPKTIYIALEKRYVFTIEHMDSVAPCYETFLTLLDKVKTENVHSKWTVEKLPLDFPKYFTYERVKELVLWKITSTAC